MILAFVLLLVATAVAWPAIRLWGTRGFPVIAGIIAASFLSFVSAGPAALSDAPPTFSVPWISALDIAISFRLDPLAWVLALVVTGVGSVVLLSCGAYFSNDEPALPRFATLLTAFAAVMAGLVVSDDVFVMFMLWEITSVFSYLLIGHTSDRRESRGAALQALLVTTFGGLAMLVGLCIIVVANGTTSLHAIVSDPVINAATPWAVLLVLAGALSKSAIVPFHFWLPSAMAAPTPVSAFLHAAAMVKAGIYLVLRLAPAYALVPGWHEVLIPLGLATMLIGSWRALRQFDLKLLLAHGTVSQLGLLIVISSIGTQETTIAALALLVAHALFKSTLFIVVGVIDHNTGTRDWRALSGLGRAQPLLAIIAIVAALSMAGMPISLGFIAKEAALTSVLETSSIFGEAGFLGSGIGASHTASIWLVVLLALGSTLTFAYSVRFVWGAFATRKARPSTDTGTTPVLVDCSRPHPHGRTSLIAPAILAFASLVLAIWPAPLDAGAHAVAASLPADGHGIHLALWHGWTPALGITGLVLAAGLLLAANRRRVAAFQAHVPAWIDLSRGYMGTLTALDWISARVTLLAQRGGLPGYLGTAFGVFVVALGGAALTPGAPNVDLVVAHSLPQLAVGILMCVAAFIAIRAERRMTAVLLVGVTGVGMVAMFALHGAPDLALTQLLVETISVVIFVLVLRRLPRRFERERGIRRVWPRAVLAIASGAVLAVIAVFAVSARTHAPISEQFPDLAYLQAHGRNIVNVLLVDIRAWDTMGEISVLVVVATGVASLVFVTHRTGRAPTIQGSARRRHGAARLSPVIEPVTGAVPIIDAKTGRPRGASATPSPDDSDPDVTRRSWLMAGRALSPAHRSLLVEVVVRLVFLPIMVVSVMLLLAGHNHPGGGFAGGLVAGLALLLRYLAAGRYELGEALPVDAGRLLGAGLALAAGTGLLSLIIGEPVLTSIWWEGHLPVLGEIAVGTPTLFDLGVYLVVLGLVLDILRSLGAGVDEQSAADKSIVDDWAEGSR